MSNYHARLADALESRFDAIHHILKTPASDEQKITFISELADPESIEALKTRALEAENE